MKKNRTLTPHGLALAALLLGSTSLAFAQTTNFYIDTFDQANSIGTSTNGYVEVQYGSDTIVWDGTVDNTGNGGGSMYIDSAFDAASDHPLAIVVTASLFAAASENPWWYQYPITNSLNLAAYTNVQFDILWDTTYSTISIDDFNSPWNITPLGSNSYAGLLVDAICATPADLAVETVVTNTMVVTNSGPPITYTTNVTYSTNNMGSGSPALVPLGNINIPDAASNGWAHVTLPINPRQAGIGYCIGFSFLKWIGNNTALPTRYDAYFWMDNIMVGGSPNPLPPVIIQNNLVKPTKGLNVLMSTAGINDREMVELVQSTNLSWVGHATPATPVTYTFTINGFPTNASDNNALAAFLFLVPNPAQDDPAPDWTEANVVSVGVQSNTNNPPNSGYLTFRYKVNEPNGNGMLYSAPPYTNAPGSNIGNESGALTTLNSTLVQGTWTITFTSDTNVELFAPDGSTTNVIFPAYNTGYFREGYVTAPKAFSVYLGGQANNSASIGADVCYSLFAITNSALSAGTNYIRDNFLNDSSLNTSQRGMLGYGKAVWSTTEAAAPSGVFIMPTNAAYWITWSAPASGYNLQMASALTGPWTMDTTDFLLNGSGSISQLVTTNFIPAGPDAFFRLVGPTPLEGPE